MKPSTSPGARLIFDIGMDECQDTDFYLAKGFRVVAVDANPTVCDMARERYSDAIADDLLTVVNAAISRDRTPLVFYICRGMSALSTADPALRDWHIRNGGHAFDEITVSGILASDLVAEYGTPYFAKVDIEGFDLICLEGLGSAPEAPTYLSSEVDFRYLERQISLMEGMGYDRFALVPQADAPKMRPPQPALEGADIDYTFAVHASGLFGRELPAPWLTGAELRARCWTQWRQYKVAGALGRLATIIPPLKAPLTRWRGRIPHVADWFDIHAKRAGKADGTEERPS